MQDAKTKGTYAKALILESICAMRSLPLWRSDVIRFRHRLPTPSRTTAEMTTTGERARCTWQRRHRHNTNKQDDGGPITAQRGYGISVGGAATSSPVDVGKRHVLALGQGAGTVTTVDYPRMVYVTFPRTATKAAGGSYTMHQYLRRRT